jgi:hypothetical protein
MTQPTLFEIANRIATHENPVRKSLCLQFPLFKNPIIKGKQLSFRAKNISTPKMTKKKSAIYFDNVMVRHQSLLMRKLGDSFSWHNNYSVE